MALIICAYFVLVCLFRSEIFIVNILHNAQYWFLTMYQLNTYSQRSCVKLVLL